MVHLKYNARFACSLLKVSKLEPFYIYTESRIQSPKSRVQSPVHVLAYTFFKKMHILIYIGRCVHHTHVIFLVSEKLALSSQNELQMLITGCHIGKPLWSTNMASPYKTFFKVAWKASTNNSKTSYRRDLRIGEVVYKFVSYNIPSSCLISLNGFEFIF